MHAFLSGTSALCGRLASQSHHCAADSLAADALAFDALQMIWRIGSTCSTPTSF